MPLDRRGLLVENDQGESLSLDVLSRGTREAVFIGLRLALLGSFARRGAMLPLVLDDVLVNFDTERVRCAAEVLCEFSRAGHQVIMFTCHEHITDIFEAAGGEVRLLPSRDGKVRQRRIRQTVEELPPPTPTAVPEEPEPVRVSPAIDPNPLLQMAAVEEPQFDPVHPLPPSPRREKKKKAKPQAAESWPDIGALSAAWRRRFASVREPAPLPPIDLKLPDFWPVAPLPPAPVAAAPASALPDEWPLAPIPEQPRPRMAASLESFEVLAYRPFSPTAERVVDPTTVRPQTTFVISQAESLPRAPKHLTPRREHQRFTWESPEMYHEE